MLGGSGMQGRTRNAREDLEFSQLPRESRERTQIDTAKQTKTKEKCEILRASTREIYNLYEAIKLNCDIITIPPNLLKKIDMKDKEIEDLRIKMDDMADEFGEMLRETLEKMSERIEVTSGNFDAPDVPIQRRMEEMKAAAEEK